MINENDFVILKKANFMKVFQVKLNKYKFEKIYNFLNLTKISQIFFYRQVIIDRFKVKIDGLIGKPYGFKYEIKVWL